FNVRSTPNANDLAYTSLALDPHTDNPYRAPVPGIQLLHCLVNETSGGLSTLVDGFAVAQALRERHPQAFALLASTPVRFKYLDVDAELTASAPLIELDLGGDPKAIHFSPRLDFVPLFALERLDAYYRARLLFDHRLRPPDFEIRFLLKSGDLVMFDICRLLLEESERPYALGLGGRVLESLRKLDHSVEGYPVSRLRHCLQAATRAMKDGADEEMIVAALIHDIGDELAPYNHAELAAAIL